MVARSPHAARVARLKRNVHRKGKQELKDFIATSIGDQDLAQPGVNFLLIRIRPQSSPHPSCVFRRIMDDAKARRGPFQRSTWKPEVVFLPASTITIPSAAITHASANKNALA